MALAAGDSHSLALCSDGTLAAWGLNADGELGEGTTNDSLVPVAVNTASGVSALNGKRVVAITAGGRHSLALCSDGTVAAWGFNGSGELGNNTTNTSLVPVAVYADVGALGGERVVAIAAGEFHSLALCSDGTVAAWGYDGDGELGDDNTTNSLVPVPTQADKWVMALAAGGRHSLALCSDGTLVAWGFNGEGQLGFDPAVVYDSLFPVELPLVQDWDGGETSWLSEKTVVAIAAGGAHSLALCSDGTVAAWGYDGDGELGDNQGSTGAHSFVPVAVNTDSALYGKTPVAIAAGGRHSLALCSDGTVAAWGYNFDGELGDDSTTNRLVPVEVNTGLLAAGQRFTHVFSGPGASHTLAVVAAPQQPTPQINLIGYGLTIPNGEASPRTADGTDFGTALVGGGTVVRTFTIQNRGSAPLNLNGTPLVAVSGPQAVDFIVTQQPTSPVASGGLTTFQVTFAPTALGIRTATLSIANNDVNQNLYVFTIQGTGGSVLDAAYNSPADVPVTVSGFTAMGKTVNFTLNFAPTPGTVLTVVNNTGPGPIVGNFADLADGQTVTLSYGWTNYTFVANYYGGSGNDLVLTWSSASAWGLANVRASQRPGTKLVDIEYDVNAACNVSVTVSTNGGFSYNLPAFRFSGDGYWRNIASGNNKQIVWDAGADWNGMYSANVRFMVTADFGIATSSACSGATAVETLDNPVSVYGRVRSVETRLPVAGATATLGGQTCATLMDGSYTLTNVNLVFGNTLTLSASGFLPSVRTAPIPAVSRAIALPDTFLQTPYSANTNRPKVTGITAQYDGIFLAGPSFPNKYTAQVSWFGLTPGKVEFYVNNWGPSYTNATSNTEATGIIDVGRDFGGSLTHGANTLTVYAVDGPGGKRSDPYVVNVTVIPAPAGLSLTQIPWNPMFDGFPQDPTVLRFKVKVPPQGSSAAFDLAMPLLSSLGLDLSSEAKLTYAIPSGLWQIGPDMPYLWLLTTPEFAPSRCKKPGLSWCLWNAQFGFDCSAKGTAQETTGFQLDQMTMHFSFDDKAKILSIYILDFLGPEGVAVQEVLSALQDIGVDLTSVERIDIYGLFGLSADLTWSYARNAFSDVVLTPNGGVEASYSPDFFIASGEMDLTATLYFPLQVVPNFAWKIQGELTLRLSASVFWHTIYDHTWILLPTSGPVPGQIASGGHWASQKLVRLPMRAKDGSPVVVEGVLLTTSNACPHPMSRDYLQAGPPQFLASGSPAKELAASGGGAPLDSFRLISRAPVKGSVGWEAAPPKTPGGPVLRPMDLGEQEDANQVDLTLVQNTFPFSQPAIAALGQELMLLYVVDNGGSNSLQFSDIGWTRWDGTNWSTPLSIRTNTQSEFVPQVKYDGNGDAIAVWQRVADPSFTNVDVTAMAAQMEIVWSRWTRTNGAWSEPVALTANDHLDNIPLLCGPMANGNVLLVWTENQANLLMGTNGPGADTVRWCEWGAARRSWSAPEVLVDGLAYRLSQSLAGAGSNAIYAWTQDGDGVLTNDTDQEVFYVAYTNGMWSTPIQYTPTGTANKNVRAVVSASGNNYLLWETDAGLVMDRNLSGTSRLVRPASQTAGFADYAVTLGPAGNLVLLWQGMSTNGSDAHYAVYDPVSDTWGRDGLLCQDPPLERSFAPVWDSVGNLTVAYDKQQLFYTNMTLTLTDGSQVTLTNMLQRGRVDLVVTKRALVKDLALGAGDFTAAGVNYLPGDPLTLTAITRNPGNLAVSNVVVGFYDGNPNTGGTLLTNVTLPEWLEAGTTNAASAVWVVPGPAAPHVLYAVVNRADLASEFNESNNVQSVSIGGTDLAVSLVSYQAETNGAVRVIAQVQNVGAPDATNSVLAIRPAGDTNAPLATADVPVLAPGQLAQVALDLPAGTQPEGTVLYTLHADDKGAVSDVDTNNNTATFAVSLWLDTDGDGIPDDWMMRYFGHPTGLASDNSRAQDDADGDGMSNLAEYLAGTDPRDAHSYLRINSLTLDGTNGVQVVWGSASNKLYSIERATALGGSGTFSPIVEHVLSTPPENAYWDSTATNSTAFFYRIKVE
jgi:alpha-tubulin suppressor-like RCC1 family protein